MLTRTWLLLPTLLLASDWSTVGGNNEHNGRSLLTGPVYHEVLWEARTLPATISMQTFTWDTFAVTSRYSFSPMQATLVCHSLTTGESLWTRLYKPGGRYVPIGVADGRVYVRDFRESGHDTMYCVDVTTGDILWQSDWTAPLGIIWCGCFAEDGDLVTPCAERGIVRLNKETGDTVWTNNRPIPNTGAEWIAMSDTIVYAWEGQGINRPKYLIAISANTGRTLHRTAELPGDGDQELPFVVAPGQVVYCQRDGGLFYAFKHTDTGFVQLWTRAEIQGSTWQNYGVGIDSTVYVPVGRRLYRLNPTDGSVMDSSPELVTGATLVPRISIDGLGFLYVMATTGQGEGRLWCLADNLDSMWCENYGYSYYSGPAIGQWERTGVMVVAGAGTLLKAYCRPTSVAERSTLHAGRHTLEASPNPCRGTALLRLTTGSLDHSTTVLRIFDSTGRLVLQKSGTVPQSVRIMGLSQDFWQINLRGFPPGIYTVRFGSASCRLVRAE